MTDHGERIYYLLQAYTRHTATDLEEQELLQWVAGTTDDTILRDYIQQLIQNAPSDEKLSEVDWENLFSRIQQRIKKEEPGIAIIRRLLRYRVAAAILALAIASGSIYFLANKKQERPEMIAGKTLLSQNDILPGNEKAILQAGNVQVVLNKKDTSFALAGNSIHITGGNLKIDEVKPTRYTLITPRGGEYKLALSDGTKVWLNAGSKLEYPAVFSGSSREVTLEGEGYFDVRHDAGHPFIVHAGQQTIRVLGTAFNVHAYSDEKEIITSLVAGKIQINALGKTLLLKPGQQAQSDREGQLLLKPDPDLEEAIAWKNGYFRFDKADIHTIMQQLSRWYDVEISYSKDMPSHYFGAIISRDNNISQILNMLESTGEVHFKIEGRKISVMP